VTGAQWNGRIATVWWRRLKDEPRPATHPRSRGGTRQFKRTDQHPGRQWTTHRLMAEDTIDAVQREWADRLTPSRTKAACTRRRVRYHKGFFKRRSRKSILSADVASASRRKNSHRSIEDFSLFKEIHAGTGALRQDCLRSRLKLFSVSAMKWRKQSRTSWHAAPARNFTAGNRPSKRRRVWRSCLAPGKTLGSGRSRAAVSEYTTKIRPFWTSSL